MNWDSSLHMYIISNSEHRYYVMFDFIAYSIIEEIENDCSVYTCMLLEKMLVFASSNCRNCYSAVLCLAICFKFTQ